MLETAYLRSKPEEARTRLIKRNLDADALLSKAAELDEHRRSTQNILDARLAEMNDQSRTIGELMKAGKKAEAEAAKQRTAELKDRITELS